MQAQAQDDRVRVAALMARMAAGDQGAVFELYDDCGARLAAVMRAHLAAVGVRDAPREEVDGLVMDACLELFACSGAWRPDGGALPWTWAAARLRGLAARWVGVHADELDEAAFDAASGAVGPAPWSGDEGSAYEVLREAGRHHGLAALLLDGLGLVGSPRDQAIVLELRLQADLGDPSPSHTVAVGLGSSPDAVRQVSSRMRRRLRRLADTDERFAPLAGLPLVA
jgi:DNA-directed RNA polymerase specialized sigma24 family protein